MEGNNQLKELLIDLAKYIPTLKRVMARKKGDIDPARMKKDILREKKKKGGEKKVMKCFTCGETGGKMYLKQISSLSRCSDELIETHHVCQNCHHRRD